MSSQHDNITIDPAFDALLRRAATLHDLSAEQNQRIRTRLGFDAAPTASTTRAGSAAPVAATPAMPASGETPIPIGSGRGTRRQWIELALGSAAIVLVALALAAIFRGMGDESPQVPGVSASPEATVTVQPSTATPTSEAASPSTDYASISMWQTGIGSPGGVAVGLDGRLYIVDNEREVVRVFTPDGGGSAEIGFSEAGPPGESDIAIGPDGSIYVLDASATARVLRFTPDGSLVAEWGGTVSFGPGSVFDALSIAVDDEGFVFIADGQSRLQKFTSDGELVDWWDRTGEYLFPTNARQMQVFDGSLYVLASGYRMPDNLSVILRFDLDGNLNAEPLVFGDEEAGLGFQPSSFAVGPAGSLFAATNTTREIVMLTLDGEVLSRWPILDSPESRPEAFSLAIAPDGTVYVVHAMRQMVQVFAPVGVGGESMELTPTMTPESEQSPGSSPAPEQGLLPAADDFGEYLNVSFEQTQQLTDFELVMPLSVPEGLGRPEIMLSTTLGISQSPDTATMFFPIAGTEPVRFVGFQQRFAGSAIAHIAGETEAVDIAGRTVNRTLVTNHEDGWTIIYWWQRDGIHHQVATSFEPPITDEMLRQLAEAIVVAEEQAAWSADNVRLIVDEGAWLLIVTEHEGRHGAGVHFGSESEEGLVAYADAVRNLGPQALDNHETVPVLITFSQPVSFEYANRLLQESGARALSFRVRSFPPNGSRGTTGMRANEDGTLSPQVGWEQRVVSGEGIFDIEAVVDRDGWETLNNDPFVFLVDVMRAIAVDVLAEHGIDGIALEDVGINSPYWLMEEYGMAPPEG